MNVGTDVPASKKEVFEAAGQVRHVHQRHLGFLWLLELRECRAFRSQQGDRVLQKPLVRYPGEVQEYGWLVSPNGSVGEGDIAEPINSPGRLALRKSRNPW